jgi:hypothetical protein
MQDKIFRGLFVLLLAFGAFCGMLFTATMLVTEPGGFGLMFRLVVCAGLAVSFLVLFVVDLYGIWTGELPHLHHKQIER